MLDLDDDSKTENTRAAYKLEQIANALPAKRAGHPSSVVFLTADAFGILPPIARLTREQAMFYFLSGFTAKLAGTEIGVTEPQPTFSTLLRRAVPAAAAAVYARMLGEKLDAAPARRVWLVNTGWTGGPFGEGQRMPIAATRGAARTPRSRASSTAPSTASTRSSASRCRSHVPGVDDALLDPRSTWADPAAYDAKARELAGMFRENFEQFAATSARPIAAAGPRRGLSDRGRGGSHASLPVVAPTGPAGAHPVAFQLRWTRRTTCSSSAPAAPACAPRSRPTTPAPTSRVVSKLHPTRSHSGAAEGGINAALGNTAEDSPEIHAFDTVKGSDYLGDQDAIEIFTREAPGDIYQLEHWGCVFSRNDEGKLAQRPFGAAGSPRTVFAADITGHVLIQVLYEQLQKRRTQGLVVYEEYFAWRLVEEDGRCTGVICWDLMNGGLKLVGGKTVILATGGAGRLYRATTNAYACTGDGMAMALRAGLPLKDMEFMQFHPTTMYPTRDPDHRGLPRRGRLPDQQGRRALHEALRAERARARLARRRLPLRADRDRRGPRHQRLRLLDLRHLGAEKILNRLPGLARARDDLRGRRPDLRADPGAARRPLPHGRRRDRQLGATELEGLYAAGEVACVSVHGANRLGGNSLMETITFGRRVGPRRGRVRARPRSDGERRREAARADAERWVKGLLDGRQGERPWQIRDELGQSMLENFGVFRHEEKMEKQVEIIAGLRERYERGVVIEDKGDVFNSDLTQAIELGYLLDLAACMLQAGIARKESRGAHSRPYDFPDARRRELPQALDHALERRRPELSYREVRMTKWEPEERKY